MKLIINVSPIIDVLPKPKFESEFYQWYQDFQELTKPYNDLADALEKHPIYDFYGSFMCLEYSNSDMFYYFLDQSKKLNGHQFFIKIKLMENEVKKINTFIMTPNKDFPTTYFCNKPISNKDVSFFNPLDKYPIKIIKYIRTKAFKKIRNDTIYKDDGFIISDELVKKFKDASLNGYELTPVSDCRGKKNHANMFALTARNILPSSEKNILRYECNEDNIKSLGYEGTLTYTEENLTNLKDFNYPCEATNRDGTTELIVSKRFKEFCEKEKIKGVDFIPIFEKESEPYNEYIELVKNLCQDLIDSNPKHRIGYSKINPMMILKDLK